MDEIKKARKDPPTPAASDPAANGEAPGETVGGAEDEAVDSELIDSGLKRAYEDILAEPVPERLLSLLEQLKRGDTQ
ncbi:MAG: NepR family anti-sigma factor [Pseudomonadota bacterium]